MLARFVGFVAGIAVFTVYFAIVGADPVLEALSGVALALISGALAWWLLDRRARAQDDERR